MPSVGFKASSRLVLLVVISLAGANLVSSQSVTTYHYDNYRTGWNQNESILTQANVNSSNFGLLMSVSLDDQVDAQPLYMPNVNITAGNYQGIHNVVYVATENNSVYAIDAQSGTILLNPNFGLPVSYPLGCNNNGPNVGINSTPVIDPSSNTLYVMVYSQQSGGPAYMLHALDIGSLTDKVTPQTVTASHLLTDGTVFQFNATYQRQRPALLLANGNVYAGFGSFCDAAANFSRGWLLGWQTGTLTPLPSNDLFDSQATSPNDFFLSSIWMSGYGPSVDDSGNILVVTGNSDPSGTTYDGVTNIQESVIKLSPDLSTIVDLFTPFSWPILDKNDQDFGSGGVMVMPDQPGSYPHLAVALGKYGEFFLMNEDNLGGYSSQSNNVLGDYYIDESCWCGESYFIDPTDSIARVVTSAGSNVGIWQLQNSTTTSLTLIAQSPSIGGGQDPGFFTSVSSNGTSNPIIWAISRPNSATDTAISLFAFNPDSGSTLATLYSGQAGTWPSFNGNADLVPIIANGEVLVASYQELAIFGLKSTKGTTTTALSSSLNPSNYGQTVTLTAQVTTTGASTPTGTVTFRNGTTVLGTETLNGSAIATLKDAKLPVGSDSLKVTYNGDSQNSKSTSPVLTQIVSQVQLSMSLSSSPNPSPAGKLVKFTATLSSNAGLPTGTIGFNYNGTTLGSGAISPSGLAVYSTATLPSGSDSVTAIYAGNSNYSSAAASETQVVNGTTTALSSNLNPSNYGQTVALTAQVTPTGTSMPTGTVTFKNGTTVLGTETLNGSGVATLNDARLPAGSDTLTATYNGDSQNGKSTSAVLIQIVNQAQVSMSLTSSPNPSNSGRTVRFTATLVSNGALPGGTVTFSYNGSTLGTGDIFAGKASISTTGLPVGRDVVSASFTGNADFSSASASVTQDVN